MLKIILMYNVQECHKNSGKRNEYLFSKFNYTTSLTEPLHLLFLPDLTTGLSYTYNSSTSTPMDWADNSVTAFRPSLTFFNLNNDK